MSNDTVAETLARDLIRQDLANQPEQLALFDQLIDEANVGMPTEARPGRPKGPSRNTQALVRLVEIEALRGRSFLHVLIAAGRLHSEGGGEDYAEVNRAAQLLNCKVKDVLAFKAKILAVTAPYMLQQLGRMSEEAVQQAVQLIFKGVSPETAGDPEKTIDHEDFGDFSDT